MLKKKAWLAERWGITVDGVDLMIKEKRIPYVKPTGTPGGPVRFDEAVIAEWERAHTVEPRVR